MRSLTRFAGWPTMVFLASTFALSATSAVSETLEREIRTVDVRFVLSRPVSVGLSPSGGAFAVADQHGNRLLVFDTQGNLIWMLGENLTLERPTAVAMTDDTEILFTLKEKLLILRASSRDLSKIDTVADLTSYEDKLKGIDQLLTMPDGNHIALDVGADQVLLFDKIWKLTRVLLSHGQGKGRVWSPTGLALDPAGNVVVSDGRNFPMQSVASDGSVLFSAGWNRPGSERSWEASCVGVDRQGIIWVADWRESRWRLFDRTGSEAEKRPFASGLLHPVGVAFTADDRMIVIEERGAILLYRLP